LIPDEAADIEIAERERLMAKQLIESLSSETFDATKYHDEYREQLLDLIERKAAGEEIVGEPEVEAPAKVLDLVAALEASLAKAATAKERHPASSARAVDVEADDEDEEDDAPAKPKPRKAAAKTAPAKKTVAKKAPAKKRTA
jgi:DNA end-binding protein Ku